MGRAVCILPAWSPSTEDFLPGGAGQITAHLTHQYPAALPTPCCRRPVCSGSIFLKGGVFPDSSYRVQKKILGRSFQNPLLCSLPKSPEVQTGKKGKSEDSGNLRVKLCHSGQRVDKDRVHAPGWCFSMLKSTHHHGSSSCTFGETTKAGGSVAQWKGELLQGSFLVWRILECYHQTSYRFVSCFN